MPYDAAAAKTRVRRQLHTTFGLAAQYRSQGSGDPVDLRVRWHSRVTPRGDHGDLLEQGYPDVIESVDQVIFDRAELETAGVTPARNDTVTITATEFGTTVLRLENHLPSLGPIEEIWRVSYE